MNHLEIHANNSRIVELSDDLAAGCDPDFDTAYGSTWLTLKMAAGHLLGNALEAGEGEEE